jgi:putative alpha-1,2-mannosidase
MFRSSMIHLLVLLSLSLCGNGRAEKDIDPFLEAEGGGNFFPGPSLPFGMVKPGPDVGADTGNAGWLADGNINGFSQTHVSGTGGRAKYGNILIQPTVGEVAPTDFSSPRDNETGSVGFYRVNLTRFSTKVEITVSRRVALYCFTYPESSKANILFDAAHCLSSGAKQHQNQRLTGSSVNIVSPTEVSGSTTVTGGWNQQTRPYTVYFLAVRYARDRIGNVARWNSEFGARGEVRRRS